MYGTSRMALCDTPVPMICCDRQAAEDRRIRLPECLCGLAENLVRLPIVDDVQRSIALRIPLLQRRDTRCLRAHSDECVARALQILRDRVPLDVDVIARGDIQPLHDDRAVECGRIRRPSHDHARRVGLSVLERQVPRRRGRRGIVVNASSPLN